MRTYRYIAQAEDDGRLIKRLIRGKMGLSHRQFSMIKGEGGMLLDGAAVHASARVRAGQVIEVALVERGGSLAEPDDAPVDVVYEDADLMIVNKCAPLACQSSVKQSENTLENRLAHRNPGRIFRPVNRLDKGTSGLMAVAVNAHAQLLLSRQLHTEAFVREYLALVCGRPPRARGVVDAPIRKADGATVRRVVHPEGKKARTMYQLVRAKGDLSLLRIRLDTGRTHQIRVHMRWLGCPVFGDFLYGSEDDRLPGRFALHSALLSLEHPETGERLSFCAPLPPEIARLLD